MKKAATVPDIREVPRETITSLDDVDAAVTEAARLEIDLVRLANEANAKVRAIEESAAKEIRPLQDRKTSLVSAVIAYVTAVRDSLKKKTVKLTCGEVSVKEGREAVTFLEGCDLDSVVAALKRRPSLKHLIETKETVSLTRLREVPEEKREELGFTIERGEPNVTVKLDLKRYEELRSTKAVAR